MKKRTPRKMSKHRARKRAPSPRIPLTIHSKMVRRRPHRRIRARRRGLAPAAVQPPGGRNGPLLRNRDSSCHSPRRRQL